MSARSKPLGISGNKILNLIKKRHYLQWNAILSPSEMEQYQIIIVMRKMIIEIQGVIGRDKCIAHKKRTPA